MVFVTGDIHGNPTRIVNFSRKQELTADDVIVILGDVGANYYRGQRDKMMKQALAELAPTILCVHGNHEARPTSIPGYQLKEWLGGTVWYQPQYPNVLFAKDGEIFMLDGHRCMVIGGAYSVDKFYRQTRGWSWWADEQPSDEIKAYVEAQLAQCPVDVIFSHTCPERYTPVECFLPMIDQSTVDRSTEEWLGEIEASIEYRAWYCGHWHINKRIDKMHFLHEAFEML